MALLAVAFVVVGLGVFLLGVSVLMWELDGQEVVEVYAQEVVIRRQAGGFRRQKKYLAEFITNLRCAPIGYRDPLTSDFLGQDSIFVRRNGLIAFDYGELPPQYFGSGVDPAGANQIVAAIQARFPQYIAVEENQT